VNWPGWPPCRLPVGRGRHLAAFFAYILRLIANYGRSLIRRRCETSGPALEQKTRKRPVLMTTKSLFLVPSALMSSAWVYGRPRFDEPRQRRKLCRRLASGQAPESLSAGGQLRSSCRLPMDQDL
jgi:hypothetical protein